MSSFWKKAGLKGRKIAVPAGFFLLLAFAAVLAAAQSSDAEKPVPILSGTAGTFSFVTAGQQQLDAQINPVLLVPIGDHWLVESRAEFQGAFQRPPGGGGQKVKLTGVLDAKLKQIHVLKIELENSK